MRNLLITLTLLLATSPVLAGENWPVFFGPNADGKSDSTGLPVEFSETKNVKWKTAIDGKAWSSPVIWGKQVWITNAPKDGKTMSAVCVDRESGKIVYDIVVFKNAKPYFCHPFNSYASCTPVIEEGRVYVHFGRYGTACIDTATGKILWERRDLDCDHFRGPGSSPMIYGNLLVVNYDGVDVQYVVAFDKRTGKTVWKKDRNIDYGTTNGDRMKGYGTPVVFDIGGKPQLINPTAGATISYEPLSGKELWRVNHGGMNNSARPLYAHGMVYITTGSGGLQLVAIRPDGKGDVTKSHIAWSMRKGVPTRPSQIMIDDLLFMISDAGVATCLEAKTGEVVWQERVSGKFSSSPVYVDGRIYVFSQEGNIPVIKPGRKYELLTINKLDNGFMASPAVAGKALFVRTEKHLYRIEK